MAKAYDTAGNYSSANSVVTVSNGSTDPGPWAKGYGSTGNDSGSAVAVDTSGNIYLAGYFTGSASFGGNTLVSNGGTDIVLAKYNNAGVHQWSVSYGGTGTETVTGIGLDSSGNIFICGYYVGAANFGGTTFTSAGQQDAFVAKYSPTGAHLWSQSFGSTSIDMFTGLVVDSQGNVVVTGWFEGTVNFGGATLTSTYGSAPNVIVAKYSPTGAHVWSETFLAGNGNYGNAIAINKRDDSIVLTGSFYSWINFGGGNLNAATATYQDIFVAKLTSTGAYVWGKRYGGTNGEKGTAVAVDNNGDVLVGGMFYLTTDLGGGTITGGAVDQDMFLAKYSGVDGSYVWGEGLTGNDGGWVNSVSCDSQNNVVVVGYYYGTFNFLSQLLTSNTDSYDVFVAKYNSTGGPVWAQSSGSSGTDGASSVAIDSSGHPVVTGYFSGSATFGGTSLTSGGSYDAFIQRINP
jgi:hypothetical protein